MSRNMDNIGATIRAPDCIAAVLSACLVLSGCGDPDTGGTSVTLPASPDPAAVETIPPQETAVTPAVPLPSASIPEPNTPSTAADTVATVIAPEKPETPVAAEGQAQSSGRESPAGAPVDGGEIYAAVCALCHRAGLNAAPKYGNKILWSRVVAKDKEKVYENALNGIRGMPARGGVATLSDEQIKAATDYMVMGSGGWRDQ